jgi:beta-galactosidase/beta-glucuronidase
MKRLLFLISIAFAAIIAASLPARAEVPRPEHPRPDLQRENWMTLNGEWQFEIDDKADGEARGLTHGKDLGDRIIVPFCPESKLSGLGYGNTRKLKHVWYRRHFEVPAAMRGQRVRIHFGAVDYHARVFINGRFAGEHSGCSAGFDFEITDLLADGRNEVVVQVKDDQWSGLQPRGKQANGESRNVFYTRTTGIWQPVWLEAVGSSFVENLAITPDPDHSRVLLQAHINGRDPDLVLKAEAFAEGRLVGSASASGPALHHLVLDLKEKHLWHPGTPFLYDLKLTLSSGGKRST